MKSSWDGNDPQVLQGIPISIDLPSEAAGRDGFTGGSHLDDPGTSRRSEQTYRSHPDRFCDP
jgi:hypothetical protein